MLFPISSTYDSFGEMRSLLRQMDDLFHRVGPSWSAANGDDLSPDLTFQDAGAELVYQVDLPGVAEDAIEIDANEAGLIVRAKTETEIPEGFRVLRRETGSGSVTHALSWPSTVDLDKVEASIRDGVLTIRAAKAAAAQPKAITVKAS